MVALRLAYLALAAGLMGGGAILIWLGSRPGRPTGRVLRVGLAGALLVALAGVVATAVLEARAARPW